MKETSASASLAGEAYSVVRQRILRGELAIGQVISRRKLASELGMSFLPVSEALLRLEFEGLLESRPRAGTRVRIPTRQDVRGHYIVREALEVQAARLYAVTATPEERAEQLSLAARVDALSERPGAGGSLYLVLHERLHRRIAEYARCPALSEAIVQTHALGSTWLCTAAHDPGAADRPRRNHQNLIEALNLGDPELATRCMRTHIEQSLEHALRRLEPYFKLKRIHGKTYARSPRVQAVPGQAIQ
jgi:DNA-binding GntR family transcriptional regulator